MEKDVIKAINKTLDKIRPFINRDGGDIEFVKFEEGIVYVKLKFSAAYTKYSKL